MLSNPFTTRESGRCAWSSSLLDFPPPPGFRARRFAPSIAARFGPPVRTESARGPLQADDEQSRSSLFAQAGADLEWARVSDLFRIMSGMTCPLSLTLAGRYAVVA